MDWKVYNLNNSIMNKTLLSVQSENLKKNIKCFSGQFEGIFLEKDKQDSNELNRNLNLKIYRLYRSALRCTALHYSV